MTTPNAREDPIVELIMRVSTWRELGEVNPQDLDRVVELAEDIGMRHAPGTCIPAWKARRGVSGGRQVLLAILLGAAAWIVLRTFALTPFWEYVTQVLFLAASFLTMAAFLTVLLSSRRRLETHGKESKSG